METLPGPLERIRPLGKALRRGLRDPARLDAHRRIFDDAVLDAAHCEYLQLLINWGVAGLLSCGGWIVLSLREGVRRGGALAAVLLPGLLAYAVQASVNIAQAPGIPLFFALLAAQRTSGSAKA